MQRQRQQTQMVVASKIAAVLASLMVVALLPRLAKAEGQAWDFSPYQVSVWIAVDPTSGVSPQFAKRIKDALMRHCDVVAGATWTLSIREAPASLKTDICESVRSVNLKQVFVGDDDSLQGDKLFLVGISRSNGRFIVRCRELDLQTRIWGQALRRGVWQTSRLPSEVAAAVTNGFSPVVKVEYSRGRSATARVRAGGLIRHEHCPSALNVGDVLCPVVRRSDRRGELQWDQVQPIDRCFLVAKEQLAHTLTCDVHSARRNPLAGRASARVERLAVRVRTGNEPTLLKLRSRTQASEPLQGYQVYVKDPAPADAEKASPARLVGRTDWRGELAIPSGDTPLRLLYVKNGIHLIARLPVVSGFRSEVTAELGSDDRRLEAEAFVKGMECEVMDLVGRREVLAARIRRRLTQGKVFEAQKLLDEIKSFKTRGDLEQMIVERQQSGLGSTDEREQLRIDRLLNGTHELIGSHLSPELVVALEREVTEARSAASPTPTP